MVLAHQTADGVRQRVHAGDAGRRLEVEQRPDVKAAGGGMPGERGAHAVFGDDALEVGDEGAQALGGDRGVLDERGRPLGARRAHQQRQDGAAQGGRLGERGGVRQVDDLHRGELRDQGPQARQTFARLVLLALVLDSQHRLLFPGQERRETGVGGQPGRGAQRWQVEQLHRRRARLQDGDVGLESLPEGGEGQGRADPHRRPRVELDLELREQRQRALGAREQTCRVGRGGEQLAQVVPGGAAGRPRPPAGDRRAVTLADRRQGSRDSRPFGPAHAVRTRAQQEALAAGEDGGDAVHLVLGLPVHDRA